MPLEKYSDVFIDWLVESGYTHCFFVAGGNSMHLLNAARKKMRCVAFVHEVSAGIAAEYFNEIGASGRAFVLVTAGPGLTNIITSISGAWLESRELLIIGGQVKSSDLATGGLRQRGIQEVDGVSMVSSTTKVAVRFTVPQPKARVLEIVKESQTPRKGPCFIEFCLDVQASPVDRKDLEDSRVIEGPEIPTISESELRALKEFIHSSQRPVLLFGGGLSRDLVAQSLLSIEELGIPVLTTWNGADSYGSDQSMWFGRPDTWGMRFSNAIIQKADLVIALGARLSLQQTGFNWQAFAPHARVVHVDIDYSELEKGHPSNTTKIRADAGGVLRKILELEVSRPNWILECQRIKAVLQLNDSENSFHDGFIQPYIFSQTLAQICNEYDTVIPCSSGGANTVMMQSFLNKTGQRFFNNKALASMGYGLAGAIGAALADKNRKTILVEGDGGFAQNLQELATVAVQKLNMKMFIFANNGYASIRMTQKNYFDGAYLGCDVESGLGFPDWRLLATAFGIKSQTLVEGFDQDAEFLESWTSNDPYLYVVPIHPEQTYYPKITSQVTVSGSMESAPLHKMSPPLANVVINELGIDF